MNVNIPHFVNFVDAVVRKYIPAKGSDVIFAVVIFVGLMFFNGVLLVNVELCEEIGALRIRLRRLDVFVTGTVPSVQVDIDAGNTRFSTVKDAVVVAVFENVSSDLAKLQFAKVVVVAVLVPANFDFGEVIAVGLSAKGADGVDFALRVSVRLNFFNCVLAGNVKIAEVIIALLVGHG